MNYSKAIEFLNRLRMFGVKLGLENTLKLAAAVGRPQDGLRFIHVAGTNGKGSTCAMLESIYRAAGLRVGLFTSPHLVSFTERMQVNRTPISPGDVARLVVELKRAPVFGPNDGCPTFFEAVTAMALLYFAEQRCDLVIWETGMGGRLDATNIVTPLASVITNVQLDHQQWLGDSIPEITREKAGIIKPGVPVVTGAGDARAVQVITGTARKLGAPLHLVTSTDAWVLGHHKVGLAGAHQQMNAAVAARVTQVLGKQIPIPDDALRQGLKETQWAGRRQTIRRANGQTVLLDGAHNPAGAQTLAAVRDGKPFALILGIMCDKDFPAVCRILASGAAKIYLVPITSERSADPKSLVDHCRRANPSAKVAVCKNLAQAFTRAESESFVVVTGSLYLVGEAMVLLGLAPPSPDRALNERLILPRRCSSIRAVTFDVGGTLIEPWPSVGAVYARVAKRHGILVAPRTLNKSFAAAWRAKKNFGYKKSDWRELVDAVFAGLAPKKPGAAFFAELYAEFAKPSSWRVFDDVRPCLDRLRREGVGLGAISNWDERLRPLLRALDLERYFDAVVISCEAGNCKPATEIFLAATGQLRLPAQSILHVGDGCREDFDGARAAGFQSLLLARGQAPATEGAIASLEQLALPIVTAP